MAKELITLILISSSCSLVGTFLVIRRQSMLTDAISHSILLGVVLSYLTVNDLSSPFMLVGAGLIGIFVAILIEGIQKTRYIDHDLAIGIVFPLMFSIAVILLSTVLKKAQICEHTVLVGDISYIIYHFLPGTQFPRIILSGLIVLVINIVFIAVFYKELKITSFDPALAKTLSISPSLLFYLLICNTSLTTVVSFNAVGTILVISFTITPPLISLLFTNDLKKSLILSVLIGIITSICGFYIADSININYSGTIAAFQLFIFIIVSFLEPRNGAIFNIFKRRKLKEEYAIIAMIVHINEHGILTKEELKESLAWSENDLKRRLNISLKKGYIKLNHNNTYKILAKGYEKLEMIK